ncbi:MAG: cupin domain-containing protein [Candidatus Bathyarchaeia archaeon]
MQSHGALIERRIFYRIDPTRPSEPGMVLQHVKGFSRAVLEGNVATATTVHEAEQEILYVADGEGRIESEGVVEKLSEGSAVLVPPRVSHTIVNESQRPLELLLVTEDVPPEAMDKVGKTALVRNYHALPVHVVSHWCYVVRVLFGAGDGLVTLHDALIVSVDGMSIGEPHPHTPGTDEVWYQLKGTSLLFLGREIRRQHPGEAFMVPPDGKTPHSTINPTDETILMFYFSHF